MHFQKDDIDVLYSPSKWCKRFDGEGSIRYYQNFVKKGQFFTFILLNNSFVYVNNCKQHRAPVSITKGYP